MDQEIKPVLAERINQQGQFFDYAETFIGAFGRVRLTRCNITEFGVAAAKKAFQISISRVIMREEIRTAETVPGDE